ncbi:MAG: hypothetical protein IPJ81_08545 [Chitinophagaceae bacterium]|nr:hypothetical protein [Chitinophagaceae bacterium]
MQQIELIFYWSAAKNVAPPFCAPPAKPLGLGLLFCSADALQHIFVVTQSAAYILFFACAAKTSRKK